MNINSAVQDWLWHLNSACNWLSYATTLFDDHYLQVLNVGKWSSKVEGSYSLAVLDGLPSILHFSAYMFMHG